jgi:Cu+-exporting ATPase
MTRRFWVSLALTIPVFLSAMSEMLPGDPARRLLGARGLAWMQLALSAPVVLWGGWPFFGAARARSSRATSTCSR